MNKSASVPLELELVFQIQKPPCTATEALSFLKVLMFSCPPIGTATIQHTYPTNPIHTYSICLFRSHIYLLNKSWHTYICCIQFTLYKREIKPNNFCKYKTSRNLTQAFFFFSFYSNTDTGKKDRAKQMKN